MARVAIVLCILRALSGLDAIAASETASVASGTRPKPLGPEVDITLNDATNRRGYLLSFTNGVITMELDSGDRLVKESGEVTSLRFIPTHDLPTANASQLTISELSKLKEFRDRRATLTKDEIQELEHLRAKASVHIEALKREIPNLNTDAQAAEYLQELARYLQHTGLSQPEIRGEMNEAVSSIKDVKIVAALKNAPRHYIIQRILEGTKPFKNLDRKAFLAPSGTVPLKGEKPPGQ